MTRLVNYHTHTKYCDGKDNPEDIVISAIEKGFFELGFSGHAYTPFDNSYCMSEQDTIRYINDIAKLKDKYKEKISIKCGIEADCFSDFNANDFDYVIGSVHYVYKNGIYYDVDKDEESLLTAINDGWNGDVYAFIQDYYKLAGDVVNKTKADIIGHFDLVTKFNENERLFSEGDERYLSAVKKALDKLISLNKPFEINTGAMQRGYRTKPYPSEHILEYIKKRGGSVIISSDCHNKESLDFGLDYAYMLAEKIGLKILYSI